MTYKNDSITRLQQQEEGAVTSFVEQFSPSLYRYLYCLTQDAEVTADCVQETLLKAYAALPRLSNDSDIASWLFTIATNVARNHLRRERIIRWVRLEWFPVQRQSHEHAILQQQFVGHILAELPLSYRVCLVLHYWRGLSCREISIIMGKRETTVRKLLERARERFRALYEQHRQDDKETFDEQ
jgi:RNA polymerase sigma-70 factor, ECF subfamily